MPTTCTLKGGARAPAYIRVFDETPYGSKGAEILSERYIQRDETIDVTTSNGRLRYEYRYSSNDACSQDVGATCSSGYITVP
jgi:hypothetical protein